jgi:hypothetical protein
MEFDYGIGPGCTGMDPAGGVVGQGLPPVRIKEVCEALNYHWGDDYVEPRCCIESICDADHRAAVNCLTGMISVAIESPW